MSTFPLLLNPNTRRQLDKQASSAMPPRAAPGAAAGGLRVAGPARVALAAAAAAGGCGGAAGAPRPAVRRGRGAVRAGAVCAVRSVDLGVPQVRASLLFGCYMLVFN